MKDYPKTQREPQARESREVLVVPGTRTRDWVETGNVIYLTLTKFVGCLS